MREKTTAARDHLEQDALVDTEPKTDGESLVRLAPAMYADSARRAALVGIPEEEGQSGQP